MGSYQPQKLYCIYFTDLFYIYDYFTHKLSKKLPSFVDALWRRRMLL